MRLRLINEMPLIGVNRHPLSTRRKQYDEFGASSDRLGFTGDTRILYNSDKFVRTMSIKLSRLTGYNINLDIGKESSNPRDDAINVAIVGDNGRRTLSPWLLLHQVAEAIYLHYIDNGRQLDGELWQFFKDMHIFNNTSFQKIFKFRSARTGAVLDHVSELITEYMWHGGKIRVNNISDSISRELKRKLEEWIGSLLDGVVGLTIRNSR